ncbi:MAG: ubiquitin-like protein Pup [Mycobacteriales bacterium]
MANKDSGSGQQRANRRSEGVEESAAETEATGADAVRERHEKLSDDVDSMLDEIDEVLEENAEDFVRSYVQKGGE